jgi:hypothetical protein
LYPNYVRRYSTIYMLNPDKNGYKGKMTSKMQLSAGKRERLILRSHVA